MRRLIKENENKKEKVADSIQTLLHIVEANKKSKYIESLELDYVNVYDRYNTLEAEIIVRGWCEDPDIGELSHTLKDIDNDMFRVIRDYELDREGNIKKCPEGDTYLMFMPIGVNWSMRDSNVEIRFHIVQDDFRDE